MESRALRCFLDGDGNRVAPRAKGGLSFARFRLSHRSQVPESVKATSIK